jgi:hypothetical protein
MSRSDDVRLLSACCRALVTAMKVSDTDQIYDDTHVRAVLGDLERGSFRLRSLQMLAAMILFGRDRLNVQAVRTSRPLLSVDDMESELQAQNAIDGDLLKDSFAVVHALAGRGSGDVALTQAINHAASQWGSWARLTLAQVYLQTANTYAILSGFTESDRVLSDWALQDERHFCALGSQ